MFTAITRNVKRTCFHPGGRLQLALMQHPPPPSYLSKLAGGGGGVGAGGGSVGGWGRGVLAAWRGGGAARNPLLSHAYLKGVSGGMGV